MIRIDMTEDRAFNILNLSDPQLSCGEWDDPGTREIFDRTVKTLISHVKPNLITVSGDLSYPGSDRAYQEFTDYFSALGIPWTCCFGNHDNQGGDEPVKHDIEILRESPCFLWEDCPEELGHGNFAIVIGGRFGLILMDTHDHVPLTHSDGSVTNEWACLTKEQILWYRDTVRMLKKEGICETALITHIPVYAYREVAKAAYREGIDQKTLPPDARGSMVFNDGYESARGVYYEDICSYPVEEGMTDALLSEGSTRTVLCGHDHINNFIIPYRSITFVYALKTGRGCYWDKRLNGGTVLTVSADGKANVRHEYVDV